MLMFSQTHLFSFLLYLKTTNFISLSFLKIIQNKTIMLKKILPLLIICCSFAFAGQAQIYKPTKWEVTKKKIKANEYEVTLTANIEKGWRLYAPTNNDDGPVGFSVELVKSKNASLIGKVKSKQKPRAKYDSIFKKKVSSFENQVTFTQRVKIKKGKKLKKIIIGYEYMVCDKTKCLPPQFKKVTLTL